MFHKSFMGRFGDALPCSANGYVPEKGDAPEDCGHWDRNDNWDLDEWDAFVKAAVKATEDAVADLEAWRNGSAP